MSYLKVIERLPNGAALAAADDFAGLLTAAGSHLVDRVPDDSAWSYSRIVVEFGDPFRKRLRDAIKAAAAVNDDFDDAHLLMLTGGGLRVSLYQDDFAALGLAAEDVERLRQMAGVGQCSLLEFYGLQDATAEAFRDAWAAERDDVNLRTKGAAVNTAGAAVVDLVRIEPDVSAAQCVEAFRVALGEW